MKKTLCIITAFIFIFLLTACGNQTNTDEIWKNAKYTSDTAFGSGAKEVKVEVKVGEHSVTFTLHTDKNTFGDALNESGIAEGYDSQYGFTITAVNGITADYNTDKSYWAFMKDGNYMTVGVDSETISGGEHYELVYTK